MMHPITAITCPLCASTTEPAAAIGAVLVCGACGASLVVDDAGVRRATAADTTALRVEDLHTLQHARSVVARPGRRSP